MFLLLMGHKERKGSDHTKKEKEKKKEDLKLPSSNKSKEVHF